ncbi:MAG TPA: hypothetical protein VGP13_02780 [Candidatus Paceibacterota bacterium]|jgi:hypothetical protein|nr:hypothetical protein [Candidatus Paceibacterota bacterium]
MKPLINFITYNNAVPIALGVLFLGGGVTFAATNPQAVLSTQQKAVSVDNTYLARLDLSLYTPRVDITAVSQDVDAYYVSYTLSTVDVADAVWRDVVKKQSLEVSKSLLGGRDLGLYVTVQLRDLVSHEEDRLKESQDIARKQISQKQVATVYGGLVGTFLDEKTETLPGYTPVVPLPVKAPTEPASTPEATTTAVTSTSSAVSDNVDAGTAQPQVPLTQEQIEELIRQRVNELLAEHEHMSGGDTPPTDVGDTPSDDTASSTPPAETPSSDSSTSDTAPEPAADTPPAP